MSSTTPQPFIRHENLPSEVVPVFIDVMTPETWARHAQSLTDAQRVFAEERGFKGETGQRLRLPEADGHVKRVLLGLGEDPTVAEMRLGSLSAASPAGYYRFGHLPPKVDAPGGYRLGYGGVPF